MVCFSKQNAYYADVILNNDVSNKKVKRPWRHIKLWDVEAPTFSLANTLTDGGKVVIFKRRPPFIL
jgi:hypothetical protein